MIKLHRLVLVALFLTTILSFTFRGTKAQPQDFVRMYIVNPLTGDDALNVSDCPVGSTFTLEFYIGNVTNMVAWQIHLTYNRTLVNYARAWFPDGNVFKEAIDRGAVPTKEVSNNVDNATDRGDLLVIMTCTYPPNSSLKYPVSVASKGLLCKVNFTIAMHPTFTQIAFVAEQQDSSSLHVTPPYYLAGFKTSVETLDGTHLAGGEPAVIEDLAIVPEFTVLLLLITIPVSLTLMLIRMRRTRKRSSEHARQAQT